jgi:hypothetical protein
MYQYDNDWIHFQGNSSNGEVQQNGRQEALMLDLSDYEEFCLPGYNAV